jgi:hypothetical protein
MPYGQNPSAVFHIKHEPNELRREFLGVCALNPWFAHDSSPRQQMFASHLGQALVFNGISRRYFQTGMEREYGKYTFSIKMPTTGDIIKTVQRYPRGISQQSVNAPRSPQTVLIYEDYQSKEIGCIDLPTHTSNHPYFGFEYQKTEAFDSLVAGKKSFMEGQIFMDSPAKDSNGNYGFGMECPIAFISLPETSEDSVLVSEDLLPMMKFKVTERRTVEVGRDSFPKGMFNYIDPATGKEVFKPFPEIGEYIREDGLMMATTRYNEKSALFEMGINDVKTLNIPFDLPCYAPPGKGKIVDIQIWHDAYNTSGLVPFGMDEMFKKYHNGMRQFYLEIYNEWKRLYRQRGAALKLTPAFSVLVKEAIAMVGEHKERIHMHRRRKPLDDYTIEFTIEYEVTPTEGFKLTDCHGGKGIICKVRPAHEMPVDAAGNRALIAMDPNSTVSRMNIGRLYEQFMNASRRDCRKALQVMLNIEHKDRHAVAKVQEIHARDPVTFNKAWDYLLGFYKIVSPQQYNWHVTGEYRDPPAVHLGKVIADDLFIFLPTENDPESEQIIQELRKHYMPTYGPVWYTGNSGLQRKTKVPVMIADMYVMLLEKIGDDWTAVASGKTQHFAVLSQMTNATKYLQPTRNSPVRTDGEAEKRIFVSYCGWELASERHDRNNNPTTHKEVTYSILTAERPTDIQCAVNRKKNPLGQDRPLVMVKHMLQTGGTKVTYEDVGFVH